MKRSALFLALLGLGVAIGLIIWQGWGDVMQAFTAAGWGIVWSSLFNIIPMLMATHAWQVLMPARRMKFSTMAFVFWVRSSVNNLMPVARIGGEIVAVRILIKNGWMKHMAVASTVVEITVSVLTVFLFDIAGILLLAHRDAETGLIVKVAISLLAGLPVIVALIVVQKIGLFAFLGKAISALTGDKWRDIISDAKRLDRAVRTLYRRYDRVIACAVWMMLSWIAGAGYIWLCLHFLGINASLTDCLIIEAMIQFTSSVAFMIPGALGAQEAAYLVLGQVLGFSPEVSLALALMRRVRDLIIYVPGLIAWQMQEGKWLLRKKQAASSANALLSS